MDLVTKKLQLLFAKEQQKQRKTAERTSLYYQLYAVIRQAITEQALPQNQLLPPTRKLAQALAISRSTVVKAYELLALEGAIQGKTGSGYTINTIAQEAPVSTKIVDSDQYPSISRLGASFQENMQLINTTDGNILGFRPGLPPLDLFPVDIWKNLTNAYWRFIKLSALTYSPASGLQKLKENIANYLLLSRQIRCSPEQVIIVSGSLQSLFVLGSALIDPGDQVAIESPTFPNVISIFSGMHAQLLPVPVDQYGLVTPYLSAAKGAFKFVHTTPSCHYPLSHRMSLKRKKALLQWANRHRAYIIENDYEHEINNATSYTPPIFTLDNEDRTIYLSTFNRLMHPSIRVGFMVVPKHLLPTIEAVLRHSHRFVPPSIQVVLNKFIEQGHLTRYVQQVIAAAANRYAIFNSAWQQYLGAAYPLPRSAINSLHITVPLSDGVSDKALTEQLKNEHLIVHPLSKCYNQEPGQQGLILGYSPIRPSAIPRKVADMATCLLST